MTDHGDWEFRPANLPFPWGSGALVQYSATRGHTIVPAKWHLIPSNDFSRVHECDRYRDRQTDHAQIHLSQ